MARPSLPSDSLSAAVRAHFGLTQPELGQFIGVSGAVVGHVEAGRRVLPAEAQRRLRPLALLLPPPEGLGPPLPAPLAGAPAPDPTTPSEPAAPLEAEPLRKRLRRVRYLLDKTRFALENHARASQAQARRRWGRAVLAALLAPAPGTPAAPAAVAQDPALDAAAGRHWLERLPDLAPGAAWPLSATEAALLALRLRLLEEEAWALAGLLAAAEAPGN